MTLIFDPKVFNYIIMALYTLNIGRWAIAGNWVDSFYWACALGITCAVTWGYGR